MTVDHAKQSQPQSIARGRALSAIGITVATIAAAVLVTVVLLGLDYDFEDGIFDPFEPARTPVALLIATIAGGWILIGTRPWVRWVVGPAFVIGAGWALLRAEFGDTPLWAVIAVAVAWAAAGLLFTIPRSVGEYLTHRPDGFMRLLGPLDGENAARRWLAAIREWEGAGVLSSRERRRLGAALAAWSSLSAVPAELQQAIAPLAPPAHEPRLRALLRRLRRRKLAAEEETPPPG